MPVHDKESNHVEQITKETRDIHTEAVSRFADSERVIMNNRSKFVDCQHCFFVNESLKQKPNIGYVSLQQIHKRESF